AAESVRDTIGFEYCLASSSGWTKSPVLWAEIGESSLTGPELVLDMTDKVVLIKEKLKAARDRQKSYADNRRKPLEFEVGDRVMLKVSPWKGVIRFGKKGKLAPRYVGPFEILERIGPVAYRLRLPEELSGIKVDKTLRFVEEPVENSDCEVMRLKCSRMVIVKVRFWLEARSLRLQAKLLAVRYLVKVSWNSKALCEHFGNCFSKKGAIDENDLAQLIYLKAIVKEIMRLYPAAPLLVPRETKKDTILQGYEIKQKTLVHVNAFAIARDPEEFLPERFLGSDIDFRGNDFELIPFGGGRRICPGITLGVLMAELLLANLIYLFDWKLPVGMKIEDIDYEAKPGFTMHKKNDLCLLAGVYFATYTMHAGGEEIESTTSNASSNKGSKSTFISLNSSKEGVATRYTISSETKRLSYGPVSVEVNREKPSRNPTFSSEKKIDN
ncbi:cytochrome P450 71A1-like protein, partial [Tanacetum coccineum]